MTTSEIRPVTEGTMEWRGMQTWYRLVGDLQQDCTQLPMVICHGGPGATHDYLTSVAELSRSGRVCVLYDQFGNGRSGQRRDAPAEFWTVELFVRELETLVEHLGIADAYHVLGHSWGGMLALELALHRPRGLRSIVVASAFASAELYSAGVAHLLRQLPASVRETIKRHEADGTIDSPEYQAAVKVFYNRHLIRSTPVPDEVRRSYAAIQHNPTVYHAMNGIHDFTITGSLRDWDIASSLNLVDVPVLLTSGRYDEVTPPAIEELQHNLPCAKRVLFEESSHMAHVEEKDRFLELVEEFFTQAESAGG